MTQREKLIDILMSKPYGHSSYEEFADYLLKSGVIVPPCKVGNTVYCIRYDKTMKPFIKPLSVVSITVFCDGGFALFTTKEDILGRTVFLTQKEAENVLAKGETDEEL